MPSGPSSSPRPRRARGSAAPERSAGEHESDRGRLGRHARHGCGRRRRRKHPQQARGGGDGSFLRGRHRVAGDDHPGRPRRGRRDVAGIGIGSPGNIDSKTGTVRYSPNFGPTWEGAPLGDRLREFFSIPVFVGNDARCATLGEYTYGVGTATRDFVLLTLGTGIGGGIVGAGELLLGQAMGAGEIGHHQIRPTDGFVCACGKIGCFEAQASGTGLIRHALALQPSFPRSTLLAGPPADLGSKGFVAPRKPGTSMPRRLGATTSAIWRSASRTSFRSSTPR